jgi:hypothetical protein
MTLIVQTVIRWWTTICTMATANDGVPNDGWRSLAKRIQTETDPEKVIDLAKQLVARFQQQSARQGQVPEPDRR